MEINFLTCKLNCLRVNERSSDSYIGRDDVLLVFSGKVVKFVQAQIYFFAV